MMKRFIERLGAKFCEHGYAILATVCIVGIVVMNPITLEQYEAAYGPVGIVRCMICDVWYLITAVLSFIGEAYRK